MISIDLAISIAYILIPLSIFLYNFYFYYTIPDNVTSNLHLLHDTIISFIPDTTLAAVNNLTFRWALCIATTTVNILPFLYIYFNKE